MVSPNFSVNFVLTDRSHGDHVNDDYAYFTSADMYKCYKWNSDSHTSSETLTSAGVITPAL